MAVMAGEREREEEEGRERRRREGSGFVAAASCRSDTPAGEVSGGGEMREMSVGAVW